MHIPQLGTRRQLLRNSPHPHPGSAVTSYFHGPSNAYQRIWQDSVHKHQAYTHRWTSGMLPKGQVRNGAERRGQEAVGSFLTAISKGALLRCKKTQAATGLKVSQGQRCCHRGVPTVIKNMPGASKSLGTGSSSCQPSQCVQLNQHNCSGQGSY